MTSDIWTITTPIDGPYVRGARELERTERGTLPHRLPAIAREQANDAALSLVESQPSAVRIAFRTEATTIELDTLRTRTTFAGMPPRPDGLIDLVVDGRVVAEASTSGGDTITLGAGEPQVDNGPVSTIRFEGAADGLVAGVKDVELWLPQYETTELIELRTDAPVEPIPATGKPVWLHHGSSISHGSNAAKPTGIWPAVASRLGGVDLVNLGFSGNALLDPFTARAIRDAEADVISVKLGINVVNLDLMRLRAFGPAVHGFLDTIRDGHPDTPLLVVTPIYGGSHEDVPGPGGFDAEALSAGTVRFVATGDPAEVAAGKLTLQVIRAELERIVRERAATDPNLHLLNGLDLYGEQDAEERPLPDGLHPDSETHQLMGERFAAFAFSEGAPLAVE